MNEASADIALELAAQGVIGKRVDEMEAGFMMALDYMIQIAEKDQDDKVLIVTNIHDFSWDTNFFHETHISQCLPSTHVTTSCLQSYLRGIETCNCHALV